MAFKMWESTLLGFKKWQGLMQMLLSLLIALQSLLTTKQLSSSRVSPSGPTFWPHLPLYQEGTGNGLLTQVNARSLTHITLYQEFVEISPYHVISYLYHVINSPFQIFHKFSHILHTSCDCHVTRL